MEPGADDAESLASGSSGSDLAPDRCSTPFTQEQLDAVRGFVDHSKTITDLRKRLNESNKEVRRCREVLISMLKERRKSKLIISADLRIQLQSAITKKRPTGKQFLNVFTATLQAEGADVFNRVTKRLERNLKETEVTVQKESLVLKRGASAAATSS